MRVGMGYDVHRLTEDRDLILGGVKIDWEKGLLGHSDADVLIHAVMDALLGAAALGDIGKHFPDTDPAYKGISSVKLLVHVAGLLKEKEGTAGRILEEFGASGPHSHIINGHVPVKTIQGEQPMKANGKLFVIDGGFSKAYQPETGIAGYTLVYHSHGMQLVQHEPFQSRQKAIEEGLDIKSTNFVLEFNSQRMMVKDTDKGKELVTQIQDLKKLLVAYRTGLIKEKI